MIMRSITTVAWLLFPFYTLFAQLIVADPVVPQPNQAVTITFDATQGTAGLADCNCDVYIHTGLITENSNNSSDWQYVPTVWGQENPAWRLDPVAGEPNKYTYTFSPNIIDYFGIPDGEEIQQLAFVFRNGDGSLEGKAAGGLDIFIDVAPPNGVLSVNLAGDPGNGVVVPIGQPLAVSGGTSIPATMMLYDNDDLVGTFDGESFNTDITFTTAGEHIVRLEASSDDGQAASTSFTTEAALRIIWDEPTDEVSILDEGSTVTFTANTGIESEMRLLLDGVEVATGNTMVTSTQTFETAGVFIVTAEATYEGDLFTSERTIVIGGPNVQDPPAESQYGITENGDDLYLQLYGEGKSDVYVIGNFNDWAIGPESRMNRSVDGSTFWIELTDLPVGEDVIFQYYVDYELRVADPYSTLVLDRFNDPFIPADIFADIPEYPIQETDGIISWVRTNAPDFEWTDQDFTPVEAEKLVIYELLVRDFLEDHSFKSLLDTLDYLDRLGINAVQFMPLNEFEGNISWGYNPSYHMALDKYYGTPEDLKAVVNACHERGMSVILDIVYNHAFSQSSLAQLWWDQANFRPSPDNPYMNVVPTHPFNVGYDFNHESAVTKDYVKAGLRYWIEEFHMDGYRFDLTKGFTQNDCGDDNGCSSQYDQSRIDILTDYADEVWSADNDAYVILEHLTTSSEENVLSQHGNGIYFWSGFNPHDEYLEASMGYPSNLRDVLAENRGFTTGNFLIAYMESHDEERMQYKNISFGNSSGNYDVQNPETGFNRMQLASTFFYTLPGPKMLWQFGELGYDFPINYCPNGTVNPNCRVDPKPIRWDYAAENGRADIYNHIRNLLQVRNEYDVFHTDDYDVVLAGNAKRIHLIGSDIDAAIVGNFGVEPVAVANPFPFAGTWYNYLTTDALEVSDPTAAITLQAGEYRIYFSEPVELPDAGLPTSVNDQSSIDVFQLKATPNPSTGQVNLSYELASATDISVRLLDASGRIINGELLSGARPAGVQNESIQLDVPAGLYFLQLQAGNELTMLKVVVQ